MYVAVQRVDVALSYRSVPSMATLAARSVRRPLRANGLAELLTRRCSIWSTGIWPPLAPLAVPWTTTVPGAVWTGRSAVTFATGV